MGRRRFTHCSCARLSSFIKLSLSNYFHIQGKRQRNAGRSAILPSATRKRPRARPMQRQASPPSVTSNAIRTPQEQRPTKPMPQRTPDNKKAEIRASSHESRPFLNYWTQAALRTLSRRHGNAGRRHNRNSRLFSSTHKGNLAERAFGEHDAAHGLKLFAALRALVDALAGCCRRCICRPEAHKLPLRPMQHGPSRARALRYCFLAETTRA